LVAVVQEGAHAVGEIGRDRDARTHIGRDPRRLRGRLDDQVDAVDSLDLEHQP
jgi:hypothetical protein